MSDKKISQLTAATTPLTGSEELAIVQGGQTLKGTVQDFVDLIRPYKVYRALLTQSGTDAPVATVLENTIGQVLFTYILPGYYRINMGTFDPNKVHIMLNNNTLFRTGDLVLNTIDFQGGVFSILCYFFNGTNFDRGDAIYAVPNRIDIQILIYP